MTNRQEEDFRILERKIRSVKTTDNEYRTRMNHKLRQEVGNDIVQEIKQQSTMVRRMESVNSTIFCMLEWNLGRTRRRGRPRSTWIPEITDDLKKIDRLLSLMTLLISLPQCFLGLPGFFLPGRIHSIIFYGRLWWSILCIHGHTG